jgi:hypothetical protein
MKHPHAQPGLLRAARVTPVVLGLGSLLLAGCQGGLPRVGAQATLQTVQCQAPTGPRPAGDGPALVSQEYGTSSTPIPTNAVQFTHEGLARSVSVQALFAGRSDTGTVQVSARLVNCLDKPLVLRARTSFMQRSTAPAEPTSAWQNVFLSPRATAVYQEKSLSGDAVALYLIELAPASP